jgi:6-phosphogluconolactonase/glucosamine-6-phosphate isomerase/deaminase
MVLLTVMSVMFRTIDSTEPVVEYLSRVISGQLSAGKRVLWLVAGGSSMPVAVAVSKALKSSGVSLEKLVMTLTDERYGDVGHADSNWQQLKELDFDLPRATLQPVLTGKEMDATVADFVSLLETEFQKADYCIALFGIGPDGHTAGILPHSPAVAEPKSACGYDAGAYKRVTMTPNAIARLDEAVVYAIGEPKWPVLEALETDLSLDDQPAQALKQVPKCTIFTDKHAKGSQNE